MKKSKVMKETVSVLKAMTGLNEMDTTEVQLYITDAEGFIIELTIGIDEEGELYKHFDQHDSIEELEQLREENADEISENVLLN